jgi:hypothetical protein
MTEISADKLALMQKIYEYNREYGQFECDVKFTAKFLKTPMNLTPELTTFNMIYHGKNGDELHYYYRSRNAAKSDDNLKKTIVKLYAFLRKNYPSVILGSTVYIEYPGNSRLYMPRTIQM